MNVEDIFGFRSGDLEAIRLSIETAVGMQFDAHESSYVPCGDYYLKRLPDGTSYRLMKNHDPLQGDWAEEDFKEMDVILYLFAPTDTQAAKKVLLQRAPGIVHLQVSLTTDTGILRRIKYVGGKEVVCGEVQLPMK